ncbi:hypothetical protein [Hymenobacter canadensis]|uniref:DUF3108 domain-containing protein n=1 Tax=Hymenobacter canadensis TaxID=2999067 RepID=A0ABY7LTA1_9BACT|nr:hypothetical protein [Hymenobacter canadensis]WBA42652.1 hypothetical protein O3303_03615 [Hymenobacter canadensis]
MSYSYLLLPALLTQLAGAAQAQRANEGGRLNNYDYINRELGHRRDGQPATGSPFLLPGWALGTVLLRTGNVQRGQWLKYDLSAERLLWRRPQGDSVELFTTLVREFTLRDSATHQTHLFRLYPEVKTEQPVLRATFFDVRYDAGRTALLRHLTRQVRTQSSNGAMTTVKKSEWSSKTVYFLKLPDQALVPVRLSSRSVLDALAPQYQAQASAYVSQQQLNLNKEADVVRLLTYYDRLQP